MRICDSQTVTLSAQTTMNTKINSKISKEKKERITFKRIGNVNS